MDIHRHPNLAQRIDRVTELPMLCLAIQYIPVFIAGYIPKVSPSVRNGATLAEYIIVALFAAELVVKVAVAERRWAYLRAHWLDVVIVVVPFLRPLRVLRVLRVLPFLARGTIGLRRVMGPYRGTYVLVVATSAVLVSTALVAIFERGADGSIHGFGDALWWAATTVTTVGYGDKFPVTPERRAVAVFLMIVGIALFGMLTAEIAAYFVESGTESDVTNRDLLVKVGAWESQLEAQHKVLEEIAKGMGRDSDPSAAPQSASLPPPHADIPRTVRAHPEPTSEHPSPYA